MCFVVQCGLATNLMSTNVLILGREDPSGRRCGSTIMKWIAVSCCRGTIHNIIHNGPVRGCGRVWQHKTSLHLDLDVRRGALESLIRIFLVHSCMVAHRILEAAEQHS